MASLRRIYLLFAFTSSFFCCSSEGGRKGLRDKETSHDNVIQLVRSIQSNRIDPSRVVRLSWQPRVFLYKGFLSDEECDHLISLARVAEEKKFGTNLPSENKQIASFRTRLNAEDDIIARIEERISAWTFLPEENSNSLHVMHYGPGGDKKNLDYFGNKSTLGLSEPMMATVILYLSNVTRGGELLFPNSLVRSKIWSDCAEAGKAQTPVKGNAILFFTLHPNAFPDESSSHARCPVLEGEMWCAAKFFQVRAVLRAVNNEKVPIQSDDIECTDEDENCPYWASAGECQRNPLYMMGSPDYFGTCRKSCNAC